jgi:Fe/S biogenesis protein NfuA
VVEEVLRGEAGDFVRSHGGVIAPVRIADGVVELAMEGACAHCPATGFTLTQRLEKAIRRGHPTLREVRRHHPPGIRP